MNIRDLETSLPYLFKAEVTPFVWGHAGIGKSSIIKQYAEKHGGHFFPLYLGTQSDLGDILGLADFVRDKNGTAVATTFATPVWLKECIDYCNKNPDSFAILFLDEFNRARKDVLNGMFSLALDKQFHTIKLPKNCHIVAAGNPPTEEYYTTDCDETALMARFAHIKLEPSFDEWVKYAKDINMEESLVGFLKEQPQLLETRRSVFELPVKCDRRAYSRVNALFKVETPTNILDQLMYGIIGIENTVAYKQYLKSIDKPLTGDEVFKGEGTDLLKKWSDPTNIAASFLSNTCDSVVEKMAALDKTGKNFTKKQETNLMTFIETLPKDVAYAFFNKLMMEHELKNFQEFYKNPENEDRLVAIVQAAKGMKKAEGKGEKADENEKSA